eukprot:1184045-Prorocentrum_minimum.AAC.3
MSRAPRVRLTPFTLTAFGPGTHRSGASRAWDFSTTMATAHSRTCLAVLLEGGQEGVRRGSGGGQVGTATPSDGPCSVVANSIANIKGVTSNKGGNVSGEMS